MPSHASRLAWILVPGLVASLASSPAFAQDDAPTPKKSDTKKTDARKKDPKKKSPDAPPKPDAATDDVKKPDPPKEDPPPVVVPTPSPDAPVEPAAAPVADDNDPSEDPNKTYRFIGIRYRDAIAPKFIINWFANGGRTVNVPMVGPEFITRHDHLEIAVSIMYADYSFNPFLFQGKNDPTTSWELVTSSLKLGYGMVDFMYEIPIEKNGEKTGRWAFLVGGGVGVAGVFGSLYRSQAYPNSPGAANNPGDPSQWSACHNAGQQGTNALSSQYCNTRSNHFWPGWSPSNPNAAGANAYSEPSWANGGSKPLIFPWIALPQFAFRFKPVKQFQAKLDFGFSTSGFWGGLSASYGIPTK